MSSTRPELFHWFLFPLALVVYAAISGLLGPMEEAVLAVFTTLVTAAHVHYGVCVVSKGVWRQFLIGPLSGSLNVYVLGFVFLVQCVVLFSLKLKKTKPFYCRRQCLFACAATSVT